jgi:hypothetical protein
LQGKKIEFEKVDISLVEGAKEKMRAICGETTLPPQLCKGDTYLGVSACLFKSNMQMLGRWGKFREVLH